MATVNEDSFLRRNGLSLALLAFLAVTLIGQILTGHNVYNHERMESRGAPMNMAQYLVSGHFVSATFENWESEFLQMAMYILLTVVLRQKGSAESRPMSHQQEHERIEPGPKPWPVRKGGIWKSLYSHSLATALSLLFLVSFGLHLEGSWRHELAARALRGEDPIPLGTYLHGSQFWFESFQNWQSEFMAVLSLVVLSIWLRQKDSPQSKPLEAPHSQTGT